MCGAVVPPIVLDDNGGIEIYANLEDACAGIEAIDVRAGGLEAFDVEGFVLRLDAVGCNVSIERAKPPVRDEQGVLRRAQQYARAVNDVRARIPNVESATAADLLSQILQLEAGVPSRNLGFLGDS